MGRRGVTTFLKVTDSNFYAEDPYEPTLISILCNAVSAPLMISLFHKKHMYHGDSSASLKKRAIAFVLCALLIENHQARLYILL